MPDHQQENRIVSVLKNAAILYDEEDRMIGAVETLTDMSERLQQEQGISLLRKSLHMDEGYHGLIGTSAVMRNLYELMENVA